MDKIGKEIYCIPDYLKDFTVESPSTIYSVESAWSNLSFESKILLIQYYSNNKFFTNVLFRSRFKDVLFKDGNAYLIIKSVKCNLFGISSVEILSKNPIAELHIKEQTSSKIDRIDDVLNSSRIDRLAFVRAFHLDNDKENVFESLLIRYYKNRSIFPKINDSDILEMLQEYDIKPVYYEFQKGRLFCRICDLYDSSISLPQIIPSSHKNIISKYITVEKWKELFFELYIDDESEESLTICSDGIFNQHQFGLNCIKTIFDMSVSEKSILYGRLLKCRNFDCPELISIILLDIECNRLETNHKLKDIEFEFELRIKNILSQIRNQNDFLFRLINRIQITTIAFYIFYKKDANKIISDKNISERLNSISGDSPINIISRVDDILNLRGGASEDKYWRLRKFIRIDEDYYIDNLKSNRLTHKFILDIQRLLINLNSLLNILEIKNRNNFFVLSKLFKISFWILLMMIFYIAFVK